MLILVCLKQLCKYQLNIIEIMYLLYVHIREWSLIIGGGGGGGGREIKGGGYNFFGPFLGRAKFFWAHLEGRVTNIWAPISVNKVIFQ